MSSESQSEIKHAESNAESSHHPRQYATKPSDTDGMPGGIPYIIGNEAAERFSFYGMKSILTIFMADYLHWMGSSEGAGMSNAEATEHYHTFTAAAYFFPVLGAFLSDIFLGKYRTILFLSIVYCLGHGALALMGMPPLSASIWLFVGLLLIAIGSGGIKPCVSAHVGDQFGERNKHLLTKVYQWFYFSINLGSFFSTLLTPWLLEHHGPHWAFGVPGVLMAVATFLFWLGRNRFVHIPAGGVQFFRETFSWTGISALLKLMCIFVFVAVFWALFDQTGSSWVLQAKSLNRTWLGVEWLESQIQAINPILVLALIPVFQFGIYPAVDKVFELTPIRKISLGLFVMVGGFGMVSLVQEWVDAGGQPSIGWQFLAYAILTASEVMVSITCLEFAYTQAPKKMKSVVMAVFLFSISLGNIFTAVVNRYIQTPSIANAVAKVDIESLTASNQIETTAGLVVAGEDSKIRLFGFDATLGTSDDVTVELNKDGKVESVTNSSETEFNSAADKIEESFFASSEQGILPDETKGNELIAGSVDEFDNQIVYKLTSRDSFLLVSYGADKVEGTKWDQVLSVTVARADTETDDQDPNQFNWLERKKIQVLAGTDSQESERVKDQLRSERGGGTETKLSRSYSIGGRVLLEGADYFWFWTYCILATAIVFVPVGYLYREKTYIQGDDDIESVHVESEAEGTAQ